MSGATTAFCKTDGTIVGILLFLETSSPPFEGRQIETSIALRGQLTPLNTVNFLF